MQTFLDILETGILIIIVILIFNFVIFIHELGHFLAAKWRGMEVDRFQIWFGKPIFSKTIKGVRYGLGSIPAGGFVSLPQMASMEGVEGEVEEKYKNLKPAKPLDKIIVAFAGPLFSFLLALCVAVIVWKVGKPDDKIDTTVIGHVIEGMPADKAGIKRGDKILAVEGNPVAHWIGDHKKSLTAQIALSEGETIEFLVERDGKQIELKSAYQIPETSMFQRRAMRVVGIHYADELMINSLYPNSPLDLAGLKKGDLLTKINGEKIWYIGDFLKQEAQGKPLSLSYSRNGKEYTVKVTPTKPKDITHSMLGVQTWDQKTPAIYSMDDNLVFTNPFTQVKDHAYLMWTTIGKIASPKTSIGFQHLQSPVGIGMNYYDMLRSDDNWRLVLWFTVLLNVNLAILNLLPLPVLDGGHIMMSTYEIIRRKPMNPKFLLFVQNMFVFILMGFMLYILSKDIFDRAMRGDAPQKTSIEFLPPATNNEEPKKPTQ